MARAVRWLVGIAVVAWAALVVAAQMTGRDLPWWFGMLPWLVIAALIAVRVLRESARSGSGQTVRRTLGPGAQGLDEVQGIQLGRPPGLVVTYGDDEPTAAELVVPHPDHLDDGPWTLRRGPDGAVVVDAGDEPRDEDGPTGA